MRTSFQCPKCNSQEVAEVIGYNINQHQRIPLTKWGLKNAILDRYICTNCGYTEEYVQLNDNFRKWANKQLKLRSPRKSDDYV